MFAILPRIISATSSSSSSAAARRCCVGSGSGGRQQFHHLNFSLMSSSRSFSKTSATAAAAEDEAHPLLLWLGDDKDKSSSSTSNSSLLLYPPPAVDPISVQTPDDILNAVNDHYAREQQFVGGMGEQDLGVWFVGDENDGDDPLNYAELCQEGIHLVKQERHGIPFSLHTSGLVFPSIQLSEIGLASLHVSLFAASPPDYAKATGRSAKDFGTLCGFIVDAVEQGMAVEVGVLEDYAGGARDLAMSLGAQNVHVYSR